MYLAVEPTDVQRSCRLKPPRYSDCVTWRWQNEDTDPRRVGLPIPLFFCSWTVPTPPEEADRLQALAPRLEEMGKVLSRWVGLDDSLEGLSDNSLDHRVSGMIDYTQPRSAMKSATYQLGHSTYKSGPEE
jgi:hypothetical protein